jgi:DNA-binding GntR family transcriptional regulator
MSRSLLADWAYDEIRTAIRTQRLARGAPILEAELVRLLGVSRTPVREALRRLEIEGYLERDDSRRLYVQTMTEQQIHDVFLVREEVEAFAVRQAATRISDSELDALDTLLAADAEALENGDVAELSRVNEQFHELILDASRNRTLREILRKLRGRVYRLSAFAVGHFDDQRRFVTEHRELVDLLRDGDGAAAEELIRRHLRRARELLAAEAGKQG